MLFRALRWLVVAAIGLSPALLEASGFGFEPTERRLGLGGAFTSQAVDASSMFANPAAAAFLRWHQLVVGSGIVVSSVDFTGADPFPGSSRLESQGLAPFVPVALAYSHQLSERTVVGLVIDQPFASKTRWSEPEAFSGRFLAQSATLRSDSIRPQLAYKLADRLGVAVALDLRFTSFAFERRLGAIHPLTQRAVDVGVMSVSSGRKLSLGFAAGFLARPGENFAVGVAYHHQASPTFEGDASFTRLSTGDADVDGRLGALVPAPSSPYETRLGLPGILAGGILYTPGDWGLMADVSWTRWSTLAPLEVSIIARPDLSTRLVSASQDALGYRAGIERRLGATWTLRAGYSHAGAAVPAESVTPGLVECAHDTVGAGFTWKPGSVWLELGDAVSRARSRATDGTSDGGFEGAYSGTRNTFGARFGWTF